MRAKTYDVIVIGGGPAGVSAAAYAQRYGLDTLMVTKDIGGQVNHTETIFSNPAAGHGITSEELVKRYEEALRMEHVPVAYERVTLVEKRGSFEVETEENSYRSRTVIIATGRGPKRINLPFDKSIRKQHVNYFTDHPYHGLKGKKNVLVIGGGYCGLDAAEELRGMVESVCIVERTSRLGGNKRRQDEIKAAHNVDIHMGATVERIYEEEDKTYAEISSTRKLERMEIDGVFVAVGTEPYTGFVRGAAKNDYGELVISLSKEKGRMYMTSVEGLFACGDCNDMPAKGFEPLSLGEGIQCAKTVCNYLGV